MDIGGVRQQLLRPPDRLLPRLRWFFLLFLLFFVVTFLPQVTVQTDRPWALRVAAATALLALAAWYLRCHGRARFPLVGVLLEVPAFVLVVLVPDDPFRALGLLYISVNFRALYGSWRHALGFTALALVTFSGSVVAAVVLGGPDRIALLLQTVPGVPVLAVIAHLVAVACERGERAAARERALSRSGTAIALAADREAVQREALAAVAAVVADLPGVAAELVLGSPQHPHPALPDARLALPLRTRDRELGTLLVSAPADLPDEVRDALEALASQVALGLANAALTADLRHRASHDGLTGLANRDLVEEWLHDALAGPDDRQVAALLLDLDGFKAVNDTHGHAAGDQLLVTTGERLRRLVREPDLVARLGGDEFVVLLAGPDAAVGAADLAARIAAEFRDGELVDGVRVGASVGVALAAPGATPGDLLSAADTSMYRMKREARAALPAQVVAR